MDGTGTGYAIHNLCIQRRKLWMFSSPTCVTKQPSQALANGGIPRVFFLLNSIKKTTNQIHQKLWKNETDVKLFGFQHYTNSRIVFFKKKYAIDQLQTSPTKKLQKKKHSPAPPTTQWQHAWNFVVSAWRAIRLKIDENCQTFGMCSIFVCWNFERIFRTVEFFTL